MTAIVRRKPSCGAKVHVLLCDLCGHLLIEHRSPSQGPWRCGCGCDWVRSDPSTPLCSVTDVRCAVMGRETFDQYRPGLDSGSTAPTSDDT